MHTIETALGRHVPLNETSTVLEDAILRLLYDYRLNPQNPNNTPMKLADIARAIMEEKQVTLAVLDALRERNPPLVEQRADFQQERTFSITGSGVSFVRNVPQGILGAVR